MFQMIEKNNDLKQSEKKYPNEMETSNLPD